MDLTFGTDSFEAQLPSRRVPRFLEPLGHELSSSGPGGLISGFATPVQRSAAGAGTGTGHAVGGTHTFAPRPWRGPAYHADFAATPEEPPPPVVPTVETERSATTHPTLDAADWLGAPLTQAPVPRDYPALQLSALQPASAVGRINPAAGDPPGVTAPLEEPSADGPSSETVAPLLGERAAAVQSASPVEPDSDAAGANPVPPLTPPHRLGLGPPLRSDQEHLSLQRSTTDAAGDEVQRASLAVPTPVEESAVHGESVPLLSERPLVELPPAAESAAPAGPGDASAAVAPAPHLPLRLEGDSAPAMVPRSTTAAVGGTAVAVQRSSAHSDVPGSALPVQPTLSGRPMSLVGVQRSASPAPAWVQATVEAATGTTVSGAQVHRGADAARASAALQARAFTAGGEVHLPAHHGSLDSGPGAALLAHELVHVAQQRQLGSTRPAEHTSSGQTLERQAQRVERAVAQRSALPLVAPDPAQTALSAGLGTLDSDGSVVFNAPLAETTTAGMPTPASPAPPGEVQRAAEDASVTPAAPVTAGGAGPAGGQTNEQLEELAKNLYDKIRERLKAELRLDRERWGRVTDLAR